MLVLIALLSINLTACNDEPETKTKAATIVGNWRCMYDAYGDLWDAPLYYVFNEDGTGYEWFSEEPYSDRLKFKYKASSFVLNLTYWSDYYREWEDYDDYVTYELSKDGNSLTLYGMDDNDMSVLHCVRIKE